MGVQLSTNAFPVYGKTVLITGGSRGMGLEAGRQLASKGANVVIVARDSQRLERALEYISRGATSPQEQRFHKISADLTDPEAATAIISQVTAWNSGPPDVVWCCAGGPQPTLFIETELSEFRSSMDSNYFSSLYMAHATLRAWLRPERDLDPDGAVTTRAPTRHLIFTSSFLALYPVGGHSAYSPSKVALRSLCDTLSQELQLYVATPVRVHIILPATILGEAFENEQKIKPDVTKMLEGPDEGQTSEVIAAKAIRGLESGQELVTTDFMTRFVMGGYLGASVRGGFWKGLADWVLGCLALFVLVIVRLDMDGKVRQWGRRFGDSGYRHTK